MSTARTSLARTVAILCGNPDFQRFLSERFPQAWSESGDFRDPDRAATVIRSACRINSRTELDTDPTAARRYHGLIGLAFSTWRSAHPTQAASATY